MKKKIHLKPGDKINRLTVIKLDRIGNHYRSYYLFRCDCGKEKIILGSGVVSGNTKSCGCLSSEVKKARRLPNNRGVINHLILQYKRHALNRNLSFNLSYSKFSKLIAGNCVYCGQPPSNIKVTKNCKEGFVYSGIDRINSARGYVVGNVGACCSLCNRAKNNMSLTDFKKWVLRLKAMAEQWNKQD